MRAMAKRALGKLEPHGILPYPTELRQASRVAKFR
jgi:hypothetical protein